MPTQGSGSSKGDEELQSDDGHDTDEGTNEEHQSNSQLPLPLHLKLQQLKDRNC